MPKYKDVQSLIFSPEFERGIHEAIARAVAEADAAGLRPAYEPAFSQLRTLEDMAKRSREEKMDVNRQMHAHFSKLGTLEQMRNQSREEKLKAHREAIAEKESREQRTREVQRMELEFHRMVLDLLEQPGQPGDWIRRKALEVFQKWEQEQPPNVIMDHWRSWFDLPIEDAKREILGERGRFMRSYSPLIAIFLDGPQLEGYWPR